MPQDIARELERNRRRRRTTTECLMGARMVSASVLAVSTGVFVTGVPATSRAPMAVPARTALAVQSAAPTRARGEELAIVDWSGAPAAADEAHEALELAVRWIPDIEALALGRTAPPPRPILIRFHGDARFGDPPRYRVPHVTWDGVVELYQYGSSHLAALPHELVHAVLRRENVPYGRFDEEGFAAYAAYVLRPSFPGFPIYGHPLDVVAGHWISTGARIPMETLRARHRELNLKCSFQGYALRSSFFIHLGGRFGRDTMRRFVTHMGSDDAYERTFGASLSTLEQGWMDAVRAAFEVDEDRLRIIESYRGQPAVRGAYICAPGRDF